MTTWQAVLLAGSNVFNVYCLVQITRQGRRARRQLDEASAYYARAQQFHEEAGALLEEARQVAGADPVRPPTLQ